MEDTGSSFDLLKSRRDGLRAAYEHLKSQASSFLEFGLRWEEFEECLNGEFEKLVVRRKEIASKEEEFSAVEKSLQQCSENLDLKMKQRDGVRKSLEACLQELKLKNEQLNKTNRMLSEKSEELGLLAKRIEFSMDMTKQYDEEIEKKENIQFLLEQSIQERSAQLDLKEMRLHKLQRILEDCTRKLQEMRNQLETVPRNSAKPNDDVIVKRSDGRPIQRDSAKQNNEPKQKTNQLQSTTDAGKELTSKVNALLQNVKPEPNERDEEHAQFVSNNMLKKYDKVPSELYSAVVRKSHDPAEMTLLLMKEMYPLHARRRSIFLLDELRKTSPLICSTVSKEAINFAREWKQESTVGNTVSDDFDALAFLKFLGTYNLESYFGTDDLLRILKLVDQQTEEFQNVSVNDNGKSIKRSRKDEEGKTSSPGIR